MKHTHSEATFYVEDNDTVFKVVFATSTDSAQHHHDRQNEHLDSARGLWSPENEEQRRRSGTEKRDKVQEQNEC